MAQALAPVLAFALIGTGCAGIAGDDPPSDKQQVEESIVAYYKAFADGDSATACNHLTENTTAQLEKAAGGRDCTEVLDEALKRPDYARIAPNLARVTVTEVKVAGDKAAARTRVPGVGRITVVPLQKEAGSWKIASPVGAE